MFGKQEVRLPPNFPVHLSIRIFSDRQGYVADICSRWSDWYRFRINLTREDVHQLNKDLQQALEELSFSFDEQNSTVQQNVLLKLAETGNYAFKCIFADPSLRETLNEVLKEGATIQFISEDFFIPWELLYDAFIEQNVDATHFWGMRYIISRASTQYTSLADLGSFVIEASYPHIGVIACSELKYVTEEEIPALQKFCESNQMSLLLLRPLLIERRNEEMEYFRGFLSQNKYQIIHFACHACKQESPSDSYLLVSNGFSITIKDFLIHDFSIKNRPFVILNACLTGTFSPLYTSNWVKVFRECGARGVLATEFHVPDKFAPMFIKELYERFVSGQSIGEALLDARRALWERQKNPLGLAYALYSSPVVRIAMASKEAE